MMLDTGTLKAGGVKDLLSEAKKDGITGALRLKQSSGRQAVLWFKNGEMYYAKEGKRRDEQVVKVVMRWKGGEFKLDNRTKAPYLGARVEIEASK